MDKAPILVLCHGSAGDVHPLLGLAQRLQQRGHPVHLLCGRLHLGAAQRLGLDAQAVDTDALPPQAVHGPGLWPAPLLWRRVLQAARASLPLAQAWLDRWPASGPRPVLVAGTFALAGPLLRELRGLRLLSVHLSPAVVPSDTLAVRLGDLQMPAWWPQRWRPATLRWTERLLFDPVVAPGVNALRADCGLPPVQRVLSRWLHSPDGAVALFPPAFAPVLPPPGLAVQQLGFPLFDPPRADARRLADDPELMQFLQAGPPPVVFYPASARRDARVFLGRALALVREPGSPVPRAVLISRDRDGLQALGPLPPGVLQRDFVPFEELLPRSAALVHLGGIGAAAQALRAGIPQLALPLHHDQFDNAQRLQDLGVARWMRRHQHAPALARALSGLLADPRTAQACAQWRQQLLAAPDALAQAADAVQALAD